jgi:hypothetical protein
MARCVCSIGMRVALLLYGQPRDLERDEQYKIHKRDILDKYEVDTYIHTWWSSQHTPRLAA